MPDTRARTGLAQMRAFDRQALHAAHLGFDHPVTGEPLAFSTPIPPDMATLQTLMEDTVAMRAKGL
jgi:23S rRNA pseudouridine1911/1915/1917 synthase